MKKYGKGLCIGFWLLSMLFLAWGETASAAGEEEYTYTVRLYAGNLGALTGEGITVDSDSVSIISDQDQVVITGLKYGDLVSIRPQEAAAALDERYHVKGVRRSGRDNSEAEAPAFYVGSDRDFVMAYAVSGDLAAYTVSYVDTEGAQILESETYYGNIGEQQYVSSRYIDGYQAQALNMVKTLSGNEAENVFTFTYAPLKAASSESASAPESAGPETPGPADEAGADIPDEDVTLGGDANAGPGDNRQMDDELLQDIEDERTPLASGQKFLENKDIEDEAVPMGTYKDERKNTVLGYLPIYIGISFAAVAALLGAALFLRKRSKTLKEKFVKSMEAGSERYSLRKKRS
ncbi:MAG: MucBP domain-containing protein [Lachnospiraceae bacterium]|nr:MucBP domain-containing protein [Lachnospiraceae bacterium]